MRTPRWTPVSAFLAILSLVSIPATAQDWRAQQQLVGMLDTLVLSRYWGMLIDPPGDPSLDLLQELRAPLFKAVSLGAQSAMADACGDRQPYAEAAQAMRRRAQLGPLAPPSLLDELALAMAEAVTPSSTENLGALASRAMPTSALVRTAADDARKVLARFSCDSAGAALFYRQLQNRDLRRTRLHLLLQEGRTIQIERIDLGSKQVEPLMRPPNRRPRDAAEVLRVLLSTAEGPATRPDRQADHNHRELTTWARVCTYVLPDGSEYRALSVYAVRYHPWVKRQHLQALFDVEVFVGFSGSEGGGNIAMFDTELCPHPHFLNPTRRLTANWFARL